MKKISLITLLMMALSACSALDSESALPQLYTGYEQGSWYKFSPATCSAELCPAY